MTDTQTSHALMPPHVTPAEVRQLSMWSTGRAAYLTASPFGNRVEFADQLTISDAWRCIAAASELDRLLTYAQYPGERWEPLPWSVTGTPRRLTWEAAAAARDVIVKRLAETWR